MPGRRGPAGPLVLCAPRSGARQPQHFAYPLLRHVVGVERPRGPLPVSYTHLRSVLPYTARQFGRAIVMPNLKPPVTTAQAALDYHERILDALPPELSFTPLMTLYLTDETSRAEILRAKAAGVVALKLYPAGATTNSDAGVTDIRKVHGTLDAMQHLSLIHI